MKDLRQVRPQKFILFTLVFFLLVMISSNCQRTSPKPENPQANVDANAGAKDAVSSPTTAAGVVPKQPAPNEEANVEGTPDNGPPATAEFAETSYNAGEIMQGDDLKHVFLVKNTGPGVLRIISAKPS
jgi:hypothetical protein